LYRIFNSVDQRGSSPLFQSLEQTVPSALLATIDRARKSVESRSPLEGERLIKEVRQCVTRLKRAQLKQLNIELQSLYNEAKEAGDRALMRQYQLKMRVTQRELLTIDSAVRMHL